MFRLQNIVKNFKSANNETKNVLSDVSLDIHEHEIITIVGPSGSGKTTFLRILAGFDKDFHGSIKYSQDNGVSFAEIPLLGKIGYVPQESSLFPWLTVEENIAFGLRLKEISKGEQENIINSLLELVGLTPFRQYYPKEISGGMRQKVTICRALAINPTSNLILLDEPFSALDSQTRNALQVDLLRIWKERNLTIVFVTHNIDEAVFLSTKVHVFSSLPAKILCTFPIQIPHPRDRTSPEFNSVRKRIMQCVQNGANIKEE